MKKVTRDASGNVNETLKTDVKLILIPIHAKYSIM